MAPPRLRQAAAMTRPALEEDDLLALLNWELAAYDECDGCHFSSIRRMRERDDTACNWLDARVRSDHRLGAGERSIVRRVVAETRREFDLRPH